MDAVVRDYIIFAIAPYFVSKTVTNKGDSECNAKLNVFFSFCSIGEVSL